MGKIKICKFNFKDSNRFSNIDLLGSLNLMVAKMAGFPWVKDVNI